MLIKQVSENFKDEWNKFVIENSLQANFLQSWEWGQFRQQCLSEEVRYLAVYGDPPRINANDTVALRGIVATVLLIKRKLPLGKFYWNCPKGPVFTCPVSSIQCQKIFELLIEEIKKNAEEEEIIFVRIAPPYEMNYELRMMNHGFKKPEILTHLKEPENTLILNLQKPEDEILNSMHQKTRYNIRLAEKKGIIISNQQSLISNKEINNFYELLQQTAARDKINIFDKDYYEKLLTYFNQLPTCPSLPCPAYRTDRRQAGGRRVTNHQLLITLFTAEYNSTPLSSIIVVDFGDTATYFYGASSDEHRNLMSNYLIQWRAIQWAKTRGYKYYDFWGIDEKRWPGVTKFKQGFVNEKTGREINYAGTFDYVLNKKWYNLYRLGKIFKSLKY